MSSLDHDGLGRYGDPLNPQADIQSMKRIWNILKPGNARFVAYCGTVWSLLCFYTGGILFFTVPVGPDVIVFNLHRRYGNIRLPLLIPEEDWEVVERVGWMEAKLTREANWRQSYEPVFVLRKREGTHRSSNDSSVGGDNQGSSFSYVDRTVQDL